MNDPRDVINKDAEWYEAELGRLRGELVNAVTLTAALSISNGCKHSDDPNAGIAPHEYQLAVERMLEEQRRAEQAQARLAKAEARLARVVEILSLYPDRNPYAPGCIGAALAAAQPEEKP